MKRILLVTLLCSLVLLHCLPASAKYDPCAVPAFVNAPPLPNVLVAIDNSASMYDLAYNVDPTNVASSTFCYDASYADATSYYGYYDNTTIYKYNTATNQFAVSTATPAIPVSCDNTVGQAYFCIQRNSNGYYFKGNFLNWLTMSKFDVMKKAMTGGKYDSAGSTLVGESRGCVGRRFVKQIPNSGVSFAVMGSTEFGHGYGKLYIGGTTRIEIYEKAGGFNNASCQEAFADLSSGNMGQFKIDSDNCLNLSGNNVNLPPFNHSTQTCWTISSGIVQGDISRIENDCERVYSDPAFLVNGQIQWANINPEQGSYACTRIPANYSYNNNTNTSACTGYIGCCYNETNGHWDDACVTVQWTRYCGILETPEVIDPSGEFQVTGNFSNIPAILIDSGIQGQLGAPIATLQNIKAQPTAPTGVLQAITTQARLGLIAYNNYGSKFELSSALSQQYYYGTTDLDGGSILSPIQDNNTNIITAFNNLTALSWTPIGELLYEATRYYGGRTTAYNPIDATCPSLNTQATCTANTSCLWDATTGCRDLRNPYTSPIEATCQTNSILLISDGSSTYDENVPGSTFAGQGAVVTDSLGFNVTQWLSAGDLSPNPSLPYNGTNFGKGVANWSHTSDINTNFNGAQVINYYTVFALGSSQGGQLLQDIATVGGSASNYYVANNPADLATQLEAVTSSMVNQAGGASSVATVTQQVEGQDIVVRGAFTTYDSNPNTWVWKGHLEAYWLDPVCSTFTTQATCNANASCSWNATDGCSGLYDFQLAANQGKFCSDLPMATRHCWDAQQYMTNHMTPAGRNIYTMLPTGAGGSPVQNSLVSTNTSLCPADPTTDLYDYLALKSDPLFVYSDCSDLVNWIRGSAWNKARDLGGWTLGDIVYSSPVVVGPPGLASIPKSFATAGAVCDCDCDNDPTLSCARQCYYCYVQRYATRKKMVYVGGNDGMLHAFVTAVWSAATNSWLYDPSQEPAGNLQIGKELWAYVPSNLLSVLKERARPSYGTQSGCRHRTMVDLSPEAYDVYIDVGDGHGRQWRTVIVGGERGGGDVYFAIDVTDPDSAPKVLWEYSSLRNMVQMELPVPANPTSYQAVMPYVDYSTKYKLVKELPISFAVPAVGQMKTTDLTFTTADRIDPLTLGTPSPTVRSLTSANLSGWFAFVGIGARIYDPTEDLPVSAAERSATLRPNLLAIDLETGVNVFQYLWPILQTVAVQNGHWATIPTNSSNSIPYALSNTTLLDIWDGTGKTASDGYIDHLYMGDMNGEFFSIKLNLDSGTTNKGAQIDITSTKGITEATASNIFRSTVQPITVTPVAAYDPQRNLRLYLGTGKFEDVGGTLNDRTDSASMSVYSMKDAAARPTLAAASCNVSPSSLPAVSISCAGSNSFAMGGFNMLLNFANDVSTGYNTGCTWVKTNGTADCCESADATCTNPRWTTIYDFTRSGERVVDSLLVAGTLVFVTSFVPGEDTCSANIGDAYLYVFDYLGGALPASVNPFQSSGFTTVANPNAITAANEYAAITTNTGVAGTTQTVGHVAKLGSGMPSRPVLDSSSKYVLVQTSDAQIHRIRVSVPQRPFYNLGWSEDDSGQ